MKKLILFTLCIVLLLGSVSAFQKVSFEEDFGDYGKIDINERDWYDPFGWVTEEKIVENILVNNTDQCLFNCYSEGISILHEEGTLFDEFEFWEGKNRNRERKTNLNDFKIFIKKNVTEEINIINEKGLPDTKLVEVEKFVEYNFETLAPGKYYWRLEGKKDLDKDVDWVATSRGEKLEQWSWWEALDGEFIIWNETGITNWWEVPTGVTNVSILMIAGGGYGGPAGAGGGSGGGGAGELYFNNSYPVTPGVNISGIVGNGSTKGTSSNGENSLWKENGITILTTLGGGYGRSQTLNGIDGGSGSGGSGEASTTGGSSTATIGLGNAGGSGQASSPRFGAGGGGAGSVGGDGSEEANNGGDGYSVWGQTWAEGGHGAGDSFTGGYTCALVNTGSGGHAGTAVNSCHGSSGIIIIRYTPITLSVTLQEPENNYKSTSSDIDFNFSISDEGVGIKNATIRAYNSTSGLVWNATNSSGYEGNYSFSHTFLEDGNYTWNVLAYANDNSSVTSSTNSFRIDTTDPVLNITSIQNTTYTDNYSTSSTFNINLNWTTIETNLDSCWYNNGTANVSITCGNNATITIPYGTHTFRVYANDTFGNLGSDSVTATWDFKLLQNSITYNANVFELSEEEFSINLSSDGSQTVTGNLVYNGTSYTGTKAGNNFEMTFTREITIPNSGNNSFYWSFNYGSEIINSSTYYQNVTELSLTNCTGGTPYFNLLVKDEETQNFLDESNNISVEANFIYYINNPLVNKSFSAAFSNNTIGFCLSPSTATIKVQGDISYEDATHVKENYFFVDETFTNQTTNITLYDLLAADSTSFVVYLLDSASIPVKNAYFELYREYLSEDDFKVVEMAKSDDSGIGIIHFVTEDENYKFNFYDSNGDLLYATTEFNAVCLDTICSLEFNLPFSSETDPFEGIIGDSNFEFTLNKTGDIVYFIYNSENGTGYDSVKLDVLGVSIANDTISICSETQTSVSSGSATCNVSGQNYDTFLGRIYVDGNLEVSRYLAESNEGWQTYGTNGIIFTLLIVLALTLLFAWHWALALIGSVSGLVLSMWLQFIPGTFATISYLVVVVIYLIVTGGDR